MSVAGPGTGRELAIVLSLETIDDIAIRGFARPPDRLIRSVARDPSVERLAVICPFRNRGARFLRRNLLDRGGSMAPLEVAFDYIEPLRLARHDPTTARSLVRTYRRYDDKVARRLAELGYGEPVAIDFNPLHVGFGALGWARSVTYYARDDWSAHPVYRPWWPALETAQERMRADSRAMAAVSEVLMSRLAPTGPSIVLPNGIDEGEWNAPDEPPGWFRELPSPRLLYVGTLDERLDTTALEILAKGLPDASIVLVGPLMADSPVASLDLPNIHRFGHQDRATIVSVTANSDACLMVHNRTPLTEAMSPLKLYEYLAGGAPVLATDLPPVRHLGDRVVLYSGSDDIIDAADKILALGRASDEERNAFIEANCWRRRHAQLLEFAFSHGH